MNLSKAFRNRNHSMSVRLLGLGISLLDKCNNSTSLLLAVWVKYLVAAKMRCSQVFDQQRQSKCFVATSEELWCCPTLYTVSVHFTEILTADWLTQPHLRHISLHEMPNVCLFDLSPPFQEDWLTAEVKGVKESVRKGRRVAEWKDIIRFCIFGLEWVWKWKVWPVIDR